MTKPTWTELTNLVAETSLNTSAEEMLMNDAANEIKKAIDINILQSITSLREMMNGDKQAKLDKLNKTKKELAIDILKNAKEGKIDREKLDDFSYTEVEIEKISEEKTNLFVEKPMKSPTSGIVYGEYLPVCKLPK